MIKKKSKHFRRLKAQLRGARKLLEKGNPFFVEKIVSLLSKEKLNIRKSKFPKALVGTHAEISEILLRQILLNNYARICTAIMQSIDSEKPVKLPIPDSWINFMKSNKIKVDIQACKFSLYKFSVIRFLKGIIKTILLLVQYNLPRLSNKPYVVFLGLTPNNLPRSKPTKSYNVISWYQKSEIEKSEIQEVWAQVRKTNISHIPPDIFIFSQIFPRFSKLSNYFQYLFKVCVSIVVAFTGMILGKWWYGLLLEESLFLHYISVVKKQDLAQEYFFHNSSWYYKPLWTYEAEKKGSIVSMYYYSTNMEKLYWGYQSADIYGMKIMQWRNFIVWDKQQMDFLKRYCPEANYRVCGIIDFVDSSTKIITDISEYKIAIFDVTPTRPAFFTSYGCAIANYYSEKLSIQFFNDIGEICDNTKVKLFWKQKRTVDRLRIDKGFIRKRDRIINRFFSAIDPDVSARKLIEKSDAVISMPFTSPAIIGKELGKPSIYYDASGQIEELKSHGIPVLKNKDELKNWYNSLNI